MSRHNQNRKDARERKKNFKDWDSINLNDVLII